MLKYKV